MDDGRTPLWGGGHETVVAALAEARGSLKGVVDGGPCSAPASKCVTVDVFSNNGVFKLPCLE